MHQTQSFAAVQPVWHLRAPNLRGKTRRAGLYAQVMCVVVALAVAGCGLATIDELGSSNRPTDAITPPGESLDDQPDVGTATPGSLLLRGSLGSNFVPSEMRRTRMFVSRQSPVPRPVAFGPRVVCSTQAVPPRVAQSSLDAEGGFVLRLADAANVPVACSLVMAPLNQLLGNFTFQGGGKNLEGNARVAHEVALAADANFGRVYYDETTFEIAVNTDNIAEQRVRSAKADGRDTDGTWTVTALDFSPPPGSVGPCASMASGTNCSASLRVGDKLALVHLDGRSGADVAAVNQQLWDVPDQARACGLRVGLEAKALEDVGLQFDRSSAAKFDYAQTVRWTNALDNNRTAVDLVQNNYALPTKAEALRDFFSCVPRVLSVAGADVSGVLCGPDAQGLTRFVASEGCTDTTTGAPATALPVAADFAGASCSIVATDTSNRVRRSRCELTASASAQRLRCSVFTGDFSATNAPLGAEAGFAVAAVASAPQLTTGARCGTADARSPAGLLAARRCYVDYLVASGVLDDAGTCLPDVAIDAGAADAAQQVTLDFRPRHLRVSDLLQPLDTDSATVATRRRWNAAALAATPNLGPVTLSCPVVRTRSATVTQLGAKRLLVTVTEQVGTDDLRPACLATFATGASRTMAYLTQNGLTQN